MHGINEKIDRLVLFRSKFFVYVVCFIIIEFLYKIRQLKGTQENCPNNMILGRFSLDGIFRTERSGNCLNNRLYAFRNAVKKVFH